MEKCARIRDRNQARKLLMQFCIINVPIIISGQWGMHSNRSQTACNHYCRRNLRVITSSHVIETENFSDWSNLVTSWAHLCSDEASNNAMQCQQRKQTREKILWALMPTFLINCMIDCCIDAKFLGKLINARNRLTLTGGENNAMMLQ